MDPNAAVETPATETVAPIEQTETLTEDEALSQAFDAAQEEEPAEPAQDEPEDHEASTQPDGEASDEPAQVDVPSDIPGPLKDVWKDIPETARESVLKSQREMAAKVSDASRQTQALGPIMDAVRQASQEIPDFANQKPAEIAASVLELARVGEAFKKDAAGTLKYLAQHNGVDLRHLVGQQPQGQQAQQDQQTINSLRQELSQIKRQMGQFSPEHLTQHFDRYTTQRTMEQEVASFAASDGIKDHWGDVEDKILVTLPVAQQALGPEAAPKDVLQRAYDMAIEQFKPSAKAPKPSGDEPLAPSDPERTKAVHRAKSVKVSGKPGGNPRPKSEDELLSDVFDRMNN